MKIRLILFFVFAISGGAYAQRYSGTNDIIPAFENQEKSNQLTASADKTTDTRPLYLVVDSFEKQHDAKELVNRLQKKGVAAEIKKYGEPGSYFVHIPKYTTNKITYQNLSNARKEFKNAWYQHLD